ncbi:MAG: pyridoxamine 5'-phosphate oxidase family protein [Thermoanaerobaculia bacterium]
MRLASIRTLGVTGSRTGKRIAETRVRRSVLRILRGNVLCSIATVTRDGRAHANTAYFACSDELELYFLSHPGALHCRNLSSNPSMAITVFDSSQRWGGLDRGLQLFGRCREARGPWLRRAERVYQRRFPSYPRWRAALGREDSSTALRLFRFLPSRLKVLDEREFGRAIFVEALVERRR